MMLKPHSPAWYDRLSGLQQGYYYPWRSKLLPHNGEDTYLDLVRQHLTPEVDLLDVACGHGELTLEWASQCRSVLAYDRVSAYIDLAKAAAGAAEAQNVTFICADSSADAHDGRPHIPAVDDAFDLLISRRGPLHWIEDARRVARSGARLIQLNPTNLVDPPWNDALPEPFRTVSYPYDGWYQWINARLASAGLSLHSSWTFDRREIFDDVEQYYRKLSWGFLPDEIPSFSEIRPLLERIFHRYGGPEGLAVPHGRFLWMSLVDGR